MHFARSKGAFDTMHGRKSQSKASNVSILFALKVSDACLPENIQLFRMNCSERE